uniref:Uncharacterized protein n=1 Tax=Anguilla anguilla TaxID=7936 RepID=A0A0E9PBT6_ANGAN
MESCSLKMLQMATNWGVNTSLIVCKDMNRNKNLSEFIECKEHKMSQILAQI